MSDTADVEIGEIVARVKLVSGDVLLAPSTLSAIVQAVLEAVEQREGHRARLYAERRGAGSARGGEGE